MQCAIINGRDEKASKFQSSQELPINAASQNHFLRQRRSFQWRPKRQYEPFLHKLIVRSWHDWLHSDTRLIHSTAQKLVLQTLTYLCSLHFKAWHTFFNLFHTCFYQWQCQFAQFAPYCHWGTHIFVCEGYYVLFTGVLYLRFHIS